MVDHRAAVAKYPGVPWSIKAFGHVLADRQAPGTDPRRLAGGRRDPARPSLVFPAELDREPSPPYRPIRSGVMAKSCRVQPWPSTSTSGPRCRSCGYRRRTFQGSGRPWPPWIRPGAQMIAFVRLAGDDVEPPAVEPSVLDAERPFSHRSEGQTLRLACRRTGRRRGSRILPDPASGGASRDARSSRCGPGRHRPLTARPSIVGIGGVQSPATDVPSFAQTVTRRFR